MNGINQPEGVKRNRLMGVFCKSRRELGNFFADVGSRLELVEPPLVQDSPHPPVGKSALRRFFADTSQRMEQHRRFDQLRASRFNVFRLIQPDENKLSAILVDLLDPQGSHGQGDLFLRLLFKPLGLSTGSSLTKEATVQREALTHGIEKYRRRMDVFIEAGALVAIENKVDSLEQKDQIKHYMEHLRQCAKRSGKKFVLIYLTPNGRQPVSLARGQREAARSDGRLHCWSYQVELRRWLESCRRDCKAVRICDFLSDFIAYLESHLKREPEADDEKNR